MLHAFNGRKVLVAVLVAVVASVVLAVRLQDSGDLRYRGTHGRIEFVDVVPTARPEVAISSPAEEPEDQLSIRPLKPARTIATWTSAGHSPGASMGSVQGMGRYLVLYASCVGTGTATGMFKGPTRRDSATLRCDGVPTYLTNLTAGNDPRLDNGEFVVGVELSGEVREWSISVVEIDCVYMSATWTICGPSQ